MASSQVLSFLLVFLAAHGESFRTPFRSFLFLVLSASFHHRVERLSFQLFHRTSPSSFHRFLSFHGSLSRIGYGFFVVVSVSHDDDRWRRFTPRLTVTIIFHRSGWNPRWWLFYASLVRNRTRFYRFSGFHRSWNIRTLNPLRSTTFSNRVATRDAFAHVWRVSCRSMVFN